jgi:predicted GNAT superfamily acetyltransferase
MTADEKFDEYVSEEEKKAYGVQDVLDEANWEDVEGMRFGMGIILGCLALFIAAGAIVGLSFGFSIAAITGKMF